MYHLYKEKSFNSLKWYDKVKQTEANNVFTPTNKFLGVYTGITLFLHISH